MFRSHYLFASHFCTPGAGHEKGGVEHGVGFGRRNYLVPLLEVASYAELNQFLLTQCLADDQRQVAGQPVTIGAAWVHEQPALLPLPAQPFRCCVTRPVCLTPYSQVEFETNRYSVPVDQAQRNLVLRAYPFVVEILHQEAVLASHDRSYGRDQDIFDPLHYLPLLAQRPGAFAHAKPLRWWRRTWPPAYEQLLARLQAEAVDGQAVREFVRILDLHRHYPAAAVEAAIAQALVYGCLHADGVELCLRPHLQPEMSPPPLDLTGQPKLLAVAPPASGPQLQCYEQLLQQPAPQLELPA